MLQKMLVSLLSIFIFIFFFQCDVNENGDGEEENGEITWIEPSGSSPDTTAYYVTINGDDSNSGTSLAQAFRTPAKAFENVRPRGKILILPGIYGGDIGLVNFGSNGDSILISGHLGIPTLDGQNSQMVGIYCENCTGLVFDSLKFQNFTDMGLAMETSDHMTVRRSIFKDNGHAVQLVDWELEGYGIHVETSEYVLIAGNDVSGNGPDPQQPPDFIMGTGINTYGNRHVIIRNNKSYQNTGGGILVEDSEDVLVASNTVYENDLDATVDEWWDGGLWVDGGHDVIVRDNLFRDNLGPGIEISDEDFQNPTGYVLENNVCDGNYYGIYIWNFGTTTWPDTGIIRNTNNQFINSTRQNVWIEE